MSSSVDALRLRSVLGRETWGAPQPFGPDGWSMVDRHGGSVIVTCSEQDDDREWVHASIAGRLMPEYADLVRLHRAAFGEGWAYQVFAPPPAHINIHPNALHLWGLLDGRNALPDFGWAGTI